MFVGVVEHFHRFRAIDFSIFVDGETHAAEAQQGSPRRDFPFFSVFHNNPLSMIHNGVRCSIHLLTSLYCIEVPDVFIKRTFFDLQLI